MIRRSGQVDPSEVGREQDHAAPGVERARRAHADADDLGARDGAVGLLDGMLGQGDEPVQHIVGARFRHGRLGRQGVQRRAVFGHAADDEIGAADVNAEDKSHADPPQP